MKTETTHRSLDLLLATMVEVTGHVVEGGLPGTIIRRVLTCALELSSGQGSYLICAWGGGELVKYSARRGALRDDPGLVEKRILPGWSGVTARACAGREQVVLSRVDDDPEISEECDLLPGVKAESLLLAPMRFGEEAVGVLGVIGRDEQLLNPENRQLLQVLADQAGVALRAGEKHQDVERLGLTDSLTNAYNYRFLLEAIEHEIGRSRRYGETFSLLMLDVDNLKIYNDVHGHLRGSQVLRGVAHLARGQLRSADILAKYGGDEFVMILPLTEREGANLVAERVRRAIAEHPFPGEEKSGRITSSLGISVFPDDGSTVEGLIDVADRALYRAKRLGRNQVSAGVDSPRARAGSDAEDASVGGEGHKQGDLREDSRNGVI